jgi:hypothetical protein
MSQRPETGTMRFEGDHTGLFIRGDDAYHFQFAIKAVLSGRATQIERPVLERLSELLSSTNEATDQKGRQNISPFEECTRGREGVHYYIISQILKGVAVGCCYVRDDTEDPGATFVEVHGKCTICEKTFT